MQERGTRRLNSWCKSVVRCTSASTLPRRLSRALCLAFVQLGLFALFAPDLASLLPVLSRGDRACALACCKRAGVCCCHKANLEPARRELTWRADSACIPSCARVPALQSQLAFPLTPPPTTFLATARRTTRLEPSDAHVAGVIAFERFERPPPLLLTAAVSPTSPLVS